MVEAEGCPTRRRQGHGITITIATIGRTMTVGIIIIIPLGLTITMGSHCSAAMTAGHAGYLPVGENVTDTYGLAHKVFFVHARA
jgi:hypothetical protein